MIRPFAAAEVAQLRWLVAALRTEDDASGNDREDRQSLARRLEQALVGSPDELPWRVADAIGRGGIALLVALAERHEARLYATESKEERAAHRGRARRYRDIAQLVGLLPFAEE